MIKEGEKYDQLIAELNPLQEEKVGLEKELENKQALQAGESKQQQINQ